MKTKINPRLKHAVISRRKVTTRMEAFKRIGTAIQGFTDDDKRIVLTAHLTLLT